MSLKQKTAPPKRGPAPPKPSQPAPPKPSQPAPPKPSQPAPPKPSQPAPPQTVAACAPDSFFCKSRTCEFANCHPRTHNVQYLPSPSKWCRKSRQPAKILILGRMTMTPHPLLTLPRPLHLTPPPPRPQMRMCTIHQNQPPLPLLYPWRESRNLRSPTCQGISRLATLLMLWWAWQVVALRPLNLNRLQVRLTRPPVKRSKKY